MLELPSEAAMQAARESLGVRAAMFGILALMAENPSEEMLAEALDAFLPALYLRGASRTQESIPETVLH